MFRIEFLRRAMGETQRSFSRRIGEPQCNLSQIERGIRKPWPRIRKSIADALGANESDLFDDRGNPLPVDWQLPIREAM